MEGQRRVARCLRSHSQPKCIRPGSQSEGHSFSPSFLHSFRQLLTSATSHPCLTPTTGNVLTNQINLPRSCSSGSQFPRRTESCWHSEVATTYTQCALCQTLVWPWLVSWFIDDDSKWEVLLLTSWSHSIMGKWKLTEPIICMSGERQSWDWSPKYLASGSVSSSTTQGPVLPFEADAYRPNHRQLPAHNRWADINQSQ